MQRATLLLALTGLSLTAAPVQAQMAPRLCLTMPAEDSLPELRIYAGDRFDMTADTGGDPAYIIDEDTDGQVGLRSGPGTEYETDGSYGLVGDRVSALQVGYDQNCEQWYLVRFPESEYEGWIKATSLHFVYGRGLFD